MVRHALWLSGALLLALCAVPNAAAQEETPSPETVTVTEADRERARQRYGRGVQLAAEERWQAALVEFEHARQLVEHPNVLQAIAGALERLGRFREAETVHGRWLELAPADDPGRAEIERMRALDAGRVAHLRLELEPATAIVMVDGEPREELAGQGERTLALDPGTHRVEVRAEGFRSSGIEVALSSGQTLDRSVALVARAERGSPVAPRVASVPTSPSDARADDPTGWILVGVGAGVTAIGGVLLSIGAVDWVTVDGAMDREWSDLEGAHGRAGPLLGVGATVAGVGLALLAVGLVLASSSDDEQVALRVGPTSLSLQGRFR